MRNINGAHATGDDFFGREPELLRLVRTLLNDSVLLSAPRRVGKSSLILRLQDLLRSGFQSHSLRQLLDEQGLLKPILELTSVPIFINVEDCTSELEFAKKLALGLQQQGHFRAGLQQELGSIIRTFMESVGVSKPPVPGLDLPLGDATVTATIRGLIDSLFSNIQAQSNSGRPIIAIDELPEFLLALEKQDHGVRRVSEFLHWLRALRQQSSDCVRWIFLGSIGLDTFVDQRSLTKTLAGLVPMSLGAWEPNEADGFLRAIGPAVGLELDAAVRAKILECAGWAIPYHLQIIIQSLVELKSARLPVNGQSLTAVTTGDVAAAIERLLQPDGYMRFDTWRQRLRDQLGDSEHRVAMLILKRLCTAPQGLPRELLQLELLRFRPQDPPEATAELLSRLLAMLQRDGYLLEQNGQYAFRSFLLREYWHRREVR